MRPLRQPVTVGDRVLGLDGSVAEYGRDAGVGSVVLVRVDGRVFEVPVLHLIGGSVALVELLLGRSVRDVTVDVDGEPGADELLLLAPLGVDDGLDTVGHRDQHGLLHHAERQVRLGQGLVERDLGHLSGHVNSSSPLVEWRMSRNPKLEYRFIY